MKTFKRTVEFIDANKRRAIVDVGITTRNGYPEFTASGRYEGAWGQCLDRIQPANHEQKLLIDLWKEYHLKDVEKLPEGVQFWPDFSGHVEGILNEIERKEEERKAQEEQKEGDAKILAMMDEYAIDDDMLEACKAYLEVMSADDLRDFEEAYAGQFPSDEDFAQDMAENIGAIDQDAKWPNNCIDWERAARELMQDYSEEGGYYFNI